MTQRFGLRNIELILPFLLGAAIFLWWEGGPSISVLIYMIYLAFFLGFIPAQRLVAWLAYILVVPALPILPYTLLAASVDLTLNDGFTPVFSDGTITAHGAWVIYSEYLAISVAAAVMQRTIVLIKRSYARRSEA